MKSTQHRFAAAFAALCCTALVPAGAVAQTRIDISMPWGPTEFHTTNAVRFAEEVKKVTKGQVEMKVHAGGALGIKANETVRAVEDNVVPMAEFAAFQNVGDVPLLGIESLPFLVDDYEQLKVMHGFARPAWEAALAKRGQKVLYVVPWPSQNFFTKKPVKTIDDLKGVKMRTYDRVTAEMVGAIGMVPQQMNNPDIVPALASGRLDAVMTSGTTAVSQKYWEFLKHTYNTNHLWASNLMVINTGAWMKLSAENRAAIEKLARELEPQFWDVSRAEHTKRMGELKANGMTVEPASKELLDRMRTVTRPMWDSFGKTAGPEAAKMLADYRAKTGK
jgi:TRAP-type C4-dicarboxylate transport system substrate-binding protein